MDCTLLGSSVHGVFQARVGCHFLLQLTLRDCEHRDFWEEKNSNVAETFLQSSGGSWSWGLGPGNPPRDWAGMLSLLVSYLAGKTHILFAWTSSGPALLPRNASEQMSLTCPFPCRHQTSMGRGGEGREAELPSLTQHLGCFSAFSGSVMGKSGSETL